MDKFCMNCGSPMKENEIFCANCGTKSETPPPSGPAARQPFHAPAFVQAIGIPKLGVMISGILLMLAAILPYASVSFLGMSESISLLVPDGEMGDGIFFILLGAAGIFCVLRDKRRLGLASGIAALLLCLFEIGQFDSLLEELSIFSGMVSKGAGYHLMILSSIAFAVFCALPFLPFIKSK